MEVTIVVAHAVRQWVQDVGKFSLFFSTLPADFFLSLSGVCKSNT